MNVRIFIDRSQYAIEVRHDKTRLIRYTKIPEHFQGGEFNVIEETEDKLIYKISPIFEKLKTERGYILNYNIKLTNWLNYFVFKTIRAVVSNSELEVKKEPAEFSRELKEFTEVKLTP